MKIRDKTQGLKTYKGRWTEAHDEQCPCRPCYNAHDCGHYGYDDRGKHIWVTAMHCATNWNGGCPHDENGELPAPRHVKLTRRTRICRRCGATLPKEYPVTDDRGEPV